MTTDSDSYFTKFTACQTEMRNMYLAALEKWGLSPNTNWREVDRVLKGVLSSHIKVIPDTPEANLILKFPVAQRTMERYKEGTLFQRRDLNRLDKHLIDETFWCYYQLKNFERFKYQEEKMLEEANKHPHPQTRQQGTKCQNLMTIALGTCCCLLVTVGSMVM